MGFLPFIPLIDKIIGAVIPDPKVKSEATAKLMELAQKGELAYLDADLQLALAQADINKIESSSSSKFKS
jgi:hypothetical protein